MSLKSKFSRVFFGSERGVLNKIDAPYWNGLRVATAGGLAAFVGAAVVAFGAVDFGRMIVVAGIFTGFIGLGYHFILMVIWFVHKRG